MAQYVSRELAPKIAELSRKFPIVTLTGPRQSGKSTLLRHEFPDYKYVSLEEPDTRAFASEDPRGFLKTYPNHVIIDEAQRVPSLFSYLQTHVDMAGEAGMYLIAGSHNFLLMEAIDQSLAGRTALLTLLPFSRRELAEAAMLPAEIDTQIFKGFYPRLYASDLSPEDYYPAYVATYVERDVRLLKNIKDLNLFVRFLRLCAGRVGQLLNLQNLAVECGVSATTAQAWLSVLEASYICWRLEPNFNNYNKRVVRTPKLYFYDTGLVCDLLGITEASQLANHWAHGALFENLVVNQFVKDAFNRGVRPDLTFWRDSAGNEVDLIQTRSGVQHAYEIKLSSTFNPDFFKGLTRWAGLSKATPEELSVIYCGPAMKRSEGSVVSFPATF